MELQEGTSMKKKSLLLLTLTAWMVALTGCLSPEPVQEGRLYIRTLIDGKDTLYIRGNTMWFVHEAYQFPGKWAGQDVPTYINQDQHWYMQWNGTISDVVTIEDPRGALPASGVWGPDNMRVKFYTPSFGKATVAEYPTPENNHTLILDLDDVEPHGAHWFYIDVDWDETVE